MKSYKYKGIGSVDFKELNGRISSQSIESAREKLLKSGVLVIEIKEVLNIKKDISLSVLKEFMYEMSLFLEGGVNVDKAIATVSRRSESEYIRNLCKDLGEQIQLGLSLSVAMENIATVSFPNHIIEAIRAGEKGNGLVLVVKNIEDQLEVELMIKSKLGQALIYPGFIIATALVVIIVLMIFVVPRIVEMYRDTEMKLPFITRFVISISDFVVENFLLISLLPIMFYFAIKLLEKSSEAYRVIRDRMVLKLPIYGDLLIKKEIIRFSQVSSMLLEAGLVISTVFSRAVKSMGNSEMKRIFMEMDSEIQSGKLKEKLVISGENKTVYLFLSELRAGIATNKIALVLIRQESFHKRTLIKRVDYVAKLIEPISIIMIGLIVGVIMLAVMQPMFSLSTGV